jgi:hypothetical protein
MQVGLSREPRMSYSSYSSTLAESRRRSRSPLQLSYNLCTTVSTPRLYYLAPPRDLGVQLKTLISPSYFKRRWAENGGQLLLSPDLRIHVRDPSRSSALLISACLVRMTHR